MGGGRLGNIKQFHEEGGILEVFFGLAGRKGAVGGSCQVRRRRGGAAIEGKKPPLRRKNSVATFPPY